MENKATLKKTVNGVYYIEIPSNFPRIARWKEGDTIEFMVGDAASPKKDDLILRKQP
jgi:bifunctional DNA-binding transcriptional regulator/antitoxin component of YhaV-PrlF toxin-antitoxin module